VKRIFVPVIIGLLFLSLAACSKAPATTSADSVSKPAAATANAPDKTQAEPQTPSAPAPALAPPITIPAGTTLRVSLIDAVSSDQSRAGDSFAASLAEPVVSDGQTILARGTKVRGRVVDAKESGRVKGRASIELKLTEVILRDGSAVNISTKPYAAVAPATKKRDAGIIGGGAGLGAVIGAIAGGGKGAAIGAVVGGGAGTGTVLATRGKEIRYAPETRLQFTLTSPIQIQL
jgi:hypothetical protein